MDLNLEHTCRICLGNQAVRDIFTFNRTRKTTKANCQQMIATLFALTPNKDDELPRKLCRKCSTKLSSAYKLKLLAGESHETLVKHFKSIENPRRTPEATNVVEEEGFIENSIKHDEMSSCMLEENFEDTPEINGNLETVLNDADLTVTLLCETKNPVQHQIYTQNSESVNINIKDGKKSTRGPIVCDLCGKLVTNISTHKMTHQPKRQYPCSSCSRVFNDYASRMRHTNIYHLGILYYCQICQKHYKNGREHVRVAHTKRELRYTCSTCSKGFPTRTQLRLHSSVHSDHRPFPCTLCTKAFRNQNMLNYHRRNVHEKERTKICHYCSKGFFDAQALKVHLRTHTGEKMFTCGECGKTLASPSAVRKHRLIHSGVKAFHCELCTKGFIDRGSLKLHMITHTRERTHPCKYCGVKFGRKHHRDRHQKTAHENKM